MKKATDGLMYMGSEQLIELSGFLIDGEVLLSDSNMIGDFKKVKVKVEPSMIKFWLEDNVQAIERLTGWSVIE
jgi:hypothetical protein